MRSCCRFVFPFLACMVGSGTFPLLARGETSRLGSLPLKPGAAGFVMVADVETVAGNGYQPVYLKFSPLGQTFTRDRHLQVVVSPHNYGATELDFTLTKAITIPEGLATFSHTLYVPHYYPWDSVELSILEDGEPIDSAGGLFHLASGLRTRFAQQTTSVGILAVADSETFDEPWKIYPDVRSLVTVLGNGPLPEDADAKRLDHAAARKLAGIVQPAWVQFRLIDDSNLHDDWLGYSQLDVILVAAPLLERIERDQPQRLEPLLNWLAAGGNLWVYAAERSSDGSLLGGMQLDSVPVNVVTSPANIAGQLNLKMPNDTTKLMYEPWSGVTKESSHYSYQNDLKLLTRGVILQKLKRAGHPFTQTVSKSEIAGQISLGSFGLGTVVSIGPDDPFPGSYQFWKSVVDIHHPGTTNWSERMGIDVPRGNDNYWMWLIPSVGQPPVKSFVLLNTMFAILIGPLCYFFFRKRQRLYLLYFVAPTLAMLVTLSLFAYALGADGTRTKIRSRQLSWIDLRNGYTTEQSRQTYYAVFGSRDGIRVPREASIYPVRNTPAFDRYYHSYGQSSRRGEISVTAADQYLAADFLPTRAQVQYLITRPRKTSNPIEFSFTIEDSSVTSHLSCELIRLVCRDSNGKYWQAENITPGNSVALVPGGEATVVQLLGPDVLPPLGSVPMLQQNRRGWGPGTGLQVSFLEKRLDAWSTNMPAGSFVATARLIDERLGVEGAVVLNSVHVVMGEIP